MDHTEMRDGVFWILTVLAGGRHHGYALLKEVADASSGAVTLKVTTLYAALDRLQERGLVAEDGDEVVDGRLRRYFRLSDAGAAALRSEADRMEAKLRQAKLVLRPLGAGSRSAATP
jgi:PadR family transcriptional regulator, regulatory protein PadR